MSNRVLVVDDERDCLDMAAISLRLFGNWEVFQAQSGEVGLAKVKELMPSVVLLDYYLSDMTGGQFLTRMRQIEGLSDLPVVVYSGSPEAAREDPACADHVQILAKPLNPDCLSDTLKKVCGLD